MTAFAILRTKKYKSLAAIRNIAKHHTREKPCTTADPLRTPKNVFYGAGSTGAEAARKVKDVISEAQQKHGKKFRSDSVKAVEYVMTASHEFWKTASKADKLGYLKKCRGWLAEKHGAGCVVAEWIHLDERSPHIHAIVVPLCNGVLNAKAFLGGKEACSDMQTDFHTQCGAPFGLERGLIKSEAKHMNQADWWAAIGSTDLTPSKMDYAKAAIGIEVATVKNTLIQANALKAFERSQENLKKRVKKVNDRERELAVQESFLGDKMKLSQRVSELERENETLKNRVRSLEGSKVHYSPGQTSAPVFQ